MIERNVYGRKKDYKAIIIYISTQLIVSLIAGITIVLIYGAKSFEIINNMTGIISFASLAIIAAIFIVIYYKKIINDAKRLTKKDIIIISSIVWIIINFIISNLMHSLKVDMNNQDAVNMALGSNKIFTIITAIIIAPVVEEIVFRYSLSTIIKNNLMFIIISSIIFGAFHEVNIAIILYIAMGLVFSIIYIKTNKNVVASMLVHLINNLIAIISMLGI